MTQPWPTFEHNYPWGIGSTHIRLTSSAPVQRLRVLTNYSPEFAHTVAPDAGADVDGVVDLSGYTLFMAVPGYPAQVETGGAFAAGVLLQTDSNGRVVQHTTGVPVMRALEASTGAGQVVWAKFTSGR